MELFNRKVRKVLRKVRKEFIIFLTILRQAQHKLGT